MTNAIIVSSNYEDLIEAALMGITNKHTYRVEVWAVDYLLHCLDQGLFDG
ncbi:unnamed protein product [marine sediment metagenome]|uniref:Uncharacterized protein n=1 Tax=marine sediment metagenome TaxID=412755 RepID=X0T8Q6_9ZZZZ